MCIGLGTWRHGAGPALDADGREEPLLPKWEAAFALSIGRLFRSGFEFLAGRSQLLGKVSQGWFQIGFFLETEILPVEFVKGLYKRFCELVNDQYLVTA